MVFQILISSMNPDPKVFEGLPAPALVISQNSKGEEFQSEKFTFLSFNERGLSKSRNRAIENTKSKFALISDEDVKFVNDIEQKVVDAFQKYPDSDILTFKIETPEGTPYKTSYPDESFIHTRSTIYRVSSVEIVVRVDSVRKKGLMFDENFGLGAKYSSGEEVIFLNDAMNSGLKLRYVPETLVFHPLESSGKVLDKKYFRSKGAIVRRLYGFNPSLGLGLLFLAKQFAKKEKIVSLSRAISESSKGFFSIKKD
ncbi:hypothetical protein SAMN04488108_3456 [Algoriphagus zhangzhouensis]|uniref:Glycosyl transferase family 2 n=1 Tax=Algoriphagus zhangzhouensis TaxID=1073327 RepID=A0A1M7ZIE1_9BACT|nr:hypothetical protein SAMN04488108_3456 [Algoriphagus zhangzhouensis]